MKNFSKIFQKVRQMTVFFSLYSRGAIRAIYYRRFFEECRSANSDEMSLTVAEGGV